MSEEPISREDFCSGFLGGQLSGDLRLMRQMTSFQLLSLAATVDLPLCCWELEPNLLCAWKHSANMVSTQTLCISVCVQWATHTCCLLVS